MTLNLRQVPVEIIYEITNWLDPFDAINLSYVLGGLKLVNNVTLKTYVKNFCRNISFEKIVNAIIRDHGFINYDILDIFSKIIYIVNRSSKYMDILGYNTYIFNIKCGKPFIATHTIPIIYNDKQIINIYFPNIDRLEYYLQKYMNFYKNGNNFYKIQKYKLKHLLNKKNE